MKRPWSLEPEAIPVPFAGDYASLCLAAVKGKLLDEVLACPACETVGQLVFTGGWVDRGVVWLQDETTVYERIDIPLACCQRCHGRFRVLPEEILPRKVFSFLVIELGCRLYLQVNPIAGPGLRTVVKEMNKTGACGPDHSTLHRWLAGLGEKVLDRLQTSIPTSALIAESAKGLNQLIQKVWQKHCQIPSWKYQSEKRHDQLKACARVLAAATLLFSDSLHPLTAWAGWLISRFHVTPWVFPTGEADTPIQHTPPIKRRVEVSSKSKKKRKEKFYEARPPPNRVLAIPDH